MAKTPLQKAVEAKRKKIRYRAIVNATGDSKLARAYRSRGDDKILLELGIAIPQRLQKAVSQKTRIKRRRAIIKFLERQLFLENRIIREWMPASVKLPFTSPGIIQPPDYGPSKPPGVRVDIPEDEEEDDEDSGVSVGIPDKIQSRVEEWSVWNKDNNYPEKFERKAEEINESFGFDKHARYGWAVLYHSYVYGVSIAVAKTWLSADTFEGGDIYAYLRNFS